MLDEGPLNERRSRDFFHGKALHFREFDGCQTPAGQTCRNMRNSTTEIREGSWPVNHHQRKILHAIFAHPVNANLEMKDIEGRC